MLSQNLFPDSLSATPLDKILPPTGAEAAPNPRRFRFLLGACLALHAFALFLALYEFGSNPEDPLAAEEIPIEVIVEPQPQAQPLPPPPPPPPPDHRPLPPIPPPPPPKPQVYEDLNPAYDAPKTATNELHENREHDKETNIPTPQAPAPSAAPPPDQDLKAKLAEEAYPEIEENKPTLDKPDAEPLDKAVPNKPTPPQPKKEATRTKDKPRETKAATMAQHLSELASVPNFSIAMAARPAPVGGGTERASYTAILYGLIMQKQQRPASAASLRYDIEVVIGFSVDELGNLTHQALYRTSGFPDLDSEAIKALHRAAPFPPPPRGYNGSYTMHMPFVAR
jgi:TonB family protein